MRNIQKTIASKSAALLCLLLLLVVFSMAYLPTRIVHAQGNPAVCARLGQGEVGCSQITGTDGKQAFPGQAGHCYYFDPGNPNAGTINNYPGWQENGCNADIFKEALCTSAEKVQQNPKCQHIGVTPDGSIENRCPTQQEIADKVPIDKQSSCDITKRYLEPLINILAALVGVAATASIIFGGVQYASSGDDPSKVSQAKSRITNSLIALVSFFFLYVFLQWLIPGGFL
jgi:hypothetical protein